MLLCARTRAIRSGLPGTASVLELDVFAKRYSGQTFTVGLVANRMVKHDNMSTFVAIDFEIANHRRDSACAVGLASVRYGRIKAARSFLIRLPVRQIGALHFLCPAGAAVAAG